MGRVRAAVAAAGPVASVGLSSASSRGPVVFLGAVDPARDRRVMVDIEAILEHRVSDTTLRARRDEWIAAGVFERLKAEATAACDRIVGLDLTEVSLDGSLHKAPCGGEGTGPNPTDRAKLGWKWSVASEADK